MTDQLKLAVETGRTDVVKSFLSTLQETNGWNIAQNHTPEGVCIGDNAFLDFNQPKMKIYNRSFVMKVEIAVEAPKMEKSAGVDNIPAELMIYQQNLFKLVGADNDIIVQKILHEPMFEGETLLHKASRECETDIVRTLLSAGADCSVKDKNGRTAYEVSGSDKIESVYREVLLQAASHSNVTQVNQLIKAGVDVNFFDTQDLQNTPLHWVASFADVDTVECLCGHGADVNKQNKSGTTALHDAVTRGNKDIVYTLLKYGADPRIDITAGPLAGQTAYQLASEKPEILEVLNNPPEVQLFVINSESSEESVQRSNSVENTIDETTPKSNLPNGDIGSANADIRRNPSGSGEPATITPTTPQLMSPTFKRAPGVDEACKPPRVVTEEKLSLLWPQPQSIVQKEGKPFRPKGTLPVFLSAGVGSALRQIRKTWLLHVEKFDNLNLKVLLDPLTPLSDLDQPHILCHVNERLCPGKGSYRLTIMQKQLKVLSNDCDTLHYAISTVIQLLMSYNIKDEIIVPQLLIEDWPQVSYRGVLFDISQGRVPNLDTFKEMVKTLSRMKINQLHLYTRFRNLKEVVWQTVYDMEDITDLDEFCHDYGIQLCPVLEVAPTVQYEELSQLYPIFQDFLSSFSFNEFVSVGPRLSSFLIDLTEDDLNMADTSTLLPIRSDQTLQICGYPLHDVYQNLLDKLPPQVVFNEYGVQATHDYKEVCKPLSKHGVTFFVCPGTAAWNSLAGCPEAAVTNVYNAVKCATSEGALGVLVCNWSGKGHITHLPFSWPGFLMGAGLSWNSDCHWEYLLGNLEELLNLHVFQNPKGVVGHAIVELGRAETYLLRCARQQSGEDCSDLPADHGSILYQLLLQPDSVVLENLTPEILQRVNRHVRKCQIELKDKDLKCQQGSSIVSELQHTCDLMILAVKLGRALVMSGRNPSGQAGLNVVNFGVTNLSATVKTDIANRLLELLEEYESLWKGRYIEHGLKYSLAAIHVLLRQLIPDEEPKTNTE